MTRRAHMLRMTGCAAAAFACMLAAASAKQGVPNALQGFSQNKDKPVKIEAASLEVRDKDKVATFSGDVNVTQGDTNMRCKSLLVFYDQDSKSSGGMKAAQPGPGGNSSIKRLEARGGVIVTQKDQTATGETGIFDMKTNTITLAGKVTVTQGQNVLRGDRLVVDMTTGAARVESGGGRVEGLFVPSSADKPGAGKDKDKDAGKDKNAKGKDAAKDKDKEGDAAPARPATPATGAPATRDAGAAPERSKPVAPRGIY